MNPQTIQTSRSTERIHVYNAPSLGPVEGSVVGCKEYPSFADSINALIPKKGGVGSVVLVGGPFCHGLVKTVSKAKPEQFFLVGFKPAEVRNIAVQIEDSFWKTYLAVFVDPNDCFEVSPVQMLAKPLWTLGVPVTISGEKLHITNAEARAVALASIGVLQSAESVVDLKNAGLLEALLKLGRLLEVSVSPDSIQVVREKVR